jgi:hypothetical protein
MEKGVSNEEFESLDSPIFKMSVKSPPFGGFRGASGKIVVRI